MCWVSGAWSIVGGGFCAYVSLRIVLHQATATNRVLDSGLLLALALFLFAMGFYVIRVFPSFLFRILARQMRVLKSMKHH